MNTYDLITQNFDELYHHGIKGQKWGIRRYQNPDGTLTEAGKKRYYDTDKRGNKILNKKGRLVNKEHYEKLNRYVDAVLYNVKNVNKSFQPEFENYKKLNKANNQHYLEEQKKWANQKGEYKNKDYYRFKDISADKWLTSDLGKQEAASYQHLKEMVIQAAKEHPLYEKKFKELRETIYNDIPQDYQMQIEYGKRAVDLAMGRLRYESIQEHDKFLK